jgi:uncharacterized protein YidB (DUF937 family)
MGIEDLAGAALRTGGGQAGLLRAISAMVAGGDLLSLLGNLSRSGMGDLVNSWVGTGENEPVSPRRLQEALGDEEIRRVAEEAGVSENEAASGLADLLPKLVDRLTPDGHVPGGDQIDDALGKLRGLLA